MFDYIHCDYPLPGKPPYGPEGHSGGYQTKDLDCTLDIYLITEDGQLKQRMPLDPEEGLRKSKEFLDFTGKINFYTSNICASGPGIYTRNGEDAISVDYVATFLNGKIIDVVEASLEVAPALPSHTNKVYRDYDDSYIDIPEVLTRVYVMYGGQDIGYYGKVEAICEKSICIKIEGDQKYHKNGDLEIVEKWQWGSTLFLNEEDALNHIQRRKDSWNKYKKIYEDYSQKWHENKGMR